MTELERLTAIDEIKRVKACYFRAVDSGDAELLRGLLAEDCVLDYRGSCTDPATGRDFLPGVNMVVNGRASFPNGGLASMGIVSVHQGHHCEIELTGETTAQAIWSMTDRLYMPDGAPFSLMTGYGHYHETYAKTGATWKIKTLRLTRIRIDAI
jgi:hypothetical protein